MFPGAGGSITTNLSDIIYKETESRGFYLYFLVDYNYITYTNIFTYRTQVLMCSKPLLPTPGKISNFLAKTFSETSLPRLETGCGRAG